MVRLSGIQIKWDSKTGPFGIQPLLTIQIPNYFVIQVPTVLYYTYGLVQLDSIILLWNVFRAITVRIKIPEKPGIQISLGFQMV